MPWKLIICTLGCFPATKTLTQTDALGWSTKFYTAFTLGLYDLLNRSDTCTASVIAEWYFYTEETYDTIHAGADGVLRSLSWTRQESMGIPRLIRESAIKRQSPNTARDKIKLLWNYQRHGKRNRQELDRREREEIYAALCPENMSSFTCNIEERNQIHMISARQE
jgi:hypothetical protein